MVGVGHHPHLHHQQHQQQQQGGQGGQRNLPMLSITTVPSNAAPSNR
jgi:hypothetical protein